MEIEQRKGEQTSSFTESMGEAFRKSLQRLQIVTDDTCEIHGDNLLIAKKPDGQTPPFCPSCQKEKMKTKLSEIVKENDEKDIKARTYDVLERESLLNDPAIKRASFDNYVAKTESEEKALSFAKARADKYVQGESFNMVLTGKAGTGKSHLAMSVAKAYNESGGKSVMFVSIDELLRKVKDSFNNWNNPYTEQYAINLVTKVDLLIIDDLGSETSFRRERNDVRSEYQQQAGEWTQKMLFGILNARERTIITTNLSGNELKNIYNPKIVSRLMRSFGDNFFEFGDIADKRVMPF